LSQEASREHGSTLDVRNAPQEELAAELGLAGVVLLPADQPLVTPEHLRAPREKQETSGKPIVASRYAGTVGVPVLFSLEYFPHLLRLEPAQGCKCIIMSNESDTLLVDCQAAEFDNRHSGRRQLGSQ